MNTFKNKSTEIFYVVSLHIYAELFNSKDKTTSNMIITHVMDHEFVSKLIDLAMRNAEKHGKRTLMKNCLRWILKRLSRH